MRYHRIKSIITLKTSFIIQAAKYLWVLKIAYQLTMVPYQCFQEKTACLPELLRLTDATLYPADLQPVGQLYFTLVPYINRGKR